MAGAQIKGQDDLGGSSTTSPIEYAHAAVPAAFKRKLEDLLNRQSVSTALSE
jgi:hypothetical protein